MAGRQSEFGVRMWGARPTPAQPDQHDRRLVLTCQFAGLASRLTALRAWLVPAATSRLRHLARAAHALLPGALGVGQNDPPKIGQHLPSISIPFSFYYYIISEPARAA